MLSASICTAARSVIAQEIDPPQPGRARVNHYPLKRTCFECGNVAECIALLRKTPLVGMANMCFCDGDGEIAGVEILNNSVVVYDDEHQPASQVMRA